MRASLFAALALSLALAACTPSYGWTGVDVSSGREVTIVQGRLPAHHGFAGRYRSPQIGLLRLTALQTRVAGAYAYEREGCNVYGQLDGASEGNLLTFAWREDHRECGRSEPVEGRGFFLYEARGESPRRARLFGRWGYSYSERQGGIWTATKLD
jgi:hypothetical protein